MRAAKEPFQVGMLRATTRKPHLSALLFAQQAGVKLQYIPYKGSGPLNTDLIGGFVKIGFNPIPVSRSAIEGKLIRALAATSLKRAAAYPDLPTVAESGLPGYDAVLTYGLVVAAGTPRPIVNKLNKVLRDALATDEVKRRLAQEGAEPMPTTPRSMLPRSTARTPNGRRSSSRPASRKNEECLREDICPENSAALIALIAMAPNRQWRWRRTIRTVRSRWSCPTRPAAATTSWRASPRRR